MENKNDYKQIYNIANSLLFRNEPSPLPPTNNLAELEEGFNSYFRDKIDKIMTNLKPTDASQTDSEYIESEYLTNRHLTKFSHIQVEDMTKMINIAPSKHCILDPIPTQLLKHHVIAIAPVITGIYNSSVDQGTVSDNLKEALLKPMIKKPNMELEFPNFRPISNLSFLSKILERGVCRELMCHADFTGHLEPLQSAYRSSHSCETALLKVKTDILSAIENQEVVCLIMLDLSATFDTISHDLLLNRLKYRFGVTDLALNWLESYLTGHTQQVILQDNPCAKAVMSRKMPLCQGIPQGSVLGPSLFSLYISPLGDICRNEGINFHSYADDQQLYLSFKLAAQMSQQACTERMEICIHKVRKWMRTNLLKLNDKKTEFILLGTNQQLKLVQDINIRIGNDIIHPVQSVRNLGFWYDSDMKNTSHINKVVSTSFINLCNISRIRWLLNKDTCKILVQALVLTQLDYCNSLLLGTTQHRLHKLQSIQNMACKVIYNKRKYDHIGMDMLNLHWLKINERITFKIAVLVYLCINGSVPGYLCNLLKYNHNRHLRSSTKGLLPVTMFKMTLVHNSSFSIQAPRIWNRIPSDIREKETLDGFKSALKTFLFQFSHDI